MARTYIKRWRGLQKRVKRLLKKKRTRYAAFSVMAVLLLVLIRIIFMSDPVSIVPQSYKPLLNTIAEGESKGNYNAYYGHPANSDIDFTKMTVAQVLEWQESFVAQGSPSSAIGKYQIVRPTLSGLVQQLGISPNALFDSTLQDKMAITLLERRGSLEYVDNKLTREQFAANISQEWAALPKTIGANPEQSYYAGDGLNAARVSVNQVYDALAQLRKTP